MSFDALHRALRDAVGRDGLVTDADVLTGHTTDWTGRFHGPATALVRPADVEAVGAVVTVARRHGIALVPQGGNTGLVGGSVPRSTLDRRQVVVRLDRLDSPPEVDPSTGTLRAGAGVTLAAAQAAAHHAGRDLGIDLAARGTATLGGVVATNAGGLSVVGHGTTRQRLRGAEAVLGDGSVVRHLRGLVKDNTGYDLPGLLCGSEGTLGLLTQVVLATSPQRPDRCVAVLACAGWDATAAVAARVRALDGLVALEVVRRAGVALVLDATDLAPPPGWDDDAVTHWLTIEVAGDGDVATPLAEALADVDARASAVAVDAPARDRLWSWRERHTEAVQHHGVPAKLDVAVPPGAVGEFEAALDARVAPMLPAGLVTFGHLGEGNEHVQLLAVGDRPELAGPAEAEVLAIVGELGGTISAEHGIGVAKVAALTGDRAPGDLAAMRAIKHALDPDDVCNPGVLFPAT